MYIPDMARLKKEIKLLENISIHIGIQGTEDSEVLKIAHVHEFGFTGTVDVTNKHGTTFKRRMNMPERSFIRASFEANKKIIERIVKEAVEEVVYNGKTTKQAANSIGRQCVGLVRNFIHQDNVKPSSHLYSEQKRTFVTLYEEEGDHILNRITYTVEGI